MTEHTKTQYLARKITTLGTFRFRKNISIFSFGVGLWALLTAEPEPLYGPLLLVLSATVWGIAELEKRGKERDSA